MTASAVPTTSTDTPILESMTALRSLARIMDADAPDVVALHHRIDALAHTDADQATTMRAALLQLTGDHEGALAQIRQLDRHDPHAELTILVDACRCHEAQGLYAKHGHLDGDTFSAMIRYGYGCGAFRQMANFARSAQHTTLNGHAAVPFDEIFTIERLMSDLHIEDKDTAGVLEVAGQVMRDHRLLFMGEKPSVDVFDIPNELQAIHLTYHLPTTPDHRRGDRRRFRRASGRPQHSGAAWAAREFFGTRIMPVDSQELIASAKLANSTATSEADWRGVCARAYYAIYKDGETFHNALSMPGSLQPGKGGLHINLIQQLQHPTISRDDPLYVKSKVIGHLMNSLHAMRVKADYHRDATVTSQDCANSLAQMESLASQLLGAAAPVMPEQ